MAANGGGYKVVWYESSESLAAKTQLLRMAGVNAILFDSCAALNADGSLVTG